MIGEKIVAAQAALNRFLVDLLGAQDEVFLYRFDSRPELVQPWTTDRRAVGAVARRGQAERRDRDLRHGRRGDSARAVGRQQQEGARRDLRRQRHEQPHARAASCSSSSANPKCWSTRSASMRRTAATTRATRRHRVARPSRHHAPAHAGARAVPRQAPRPQASAPTAPPPPPPPHRHRVARSSSSIDRVNPDALRAHHRRQRRPHGDHRVAEAISIPRRPASPTS